MSGFVEIAAGYRVRGSKCQPGLNVCVITRGPDAALKAAALFSDTAQDLMWAETQRGLPCLSRHAREAKRRVSVVFLLDSHGHVKRNWPKRSAYCQALSWEVPR